MSKHFIIFMLSTLGFYIHAQTIDINKPEIAYIGKFSSYYEDKNSQMSIQDIRRLSQTKFKPLLKNVDSHIFTQSTFWYKLSFNNTTEKELLRYILFDLPWLDSISVNIINQNNKVTVYKSGNNLAFIQRAYKTNLINIKHEFEKGVSSVFIRVKTDDPFVVPISLLDEKEFLKKIFRETGFSFALYAVILSMLVFNLIQYFIIKNSSYLYYSIFLLSFIIMSLSYNNYTFQYFFYNYPIIQNWVQSSTIFLFSIMGLIFAKSFLELKTKHPNINILTNILIVIFVLLMTSSTFLGYHTHIKLAIIFSVVFSVFTLCIALYSLRQGNISAKFFVIGTSFGLLGTTITALSVMAIIPYSWLGFKAIDFGIVVDTILISSALANRYVILHKNLQKVKNHLDDANINLEKIVLSRTQMLSVEVNNKNLLLKELSHRVKNNLQMIVALFSIQVKEVNDITAKSILNENIKRIKAISLLHENLFNSDDLEHVQLKDYIQSIVDNFKQTTSHDTNIVYIVKSKDIQLNLDDLMPIGLIINELLTNSIKYAFESSQNSRIVKINLDSNKKFMVLEYSDNGKGLVSHTNDGFGTKLLNSLVTYQLNGKISYFNDNGLRYKISIPMIK